MATVVLLLQLLFRTTTLAATTTATTSTSAAAAAEREDLFACFECRREDNPDETHLHEEFGRVMRIVV